jgi:iron complex outermembrane recepter protein
MRKSLSMILAMMATTWVMPSIAQETGLRPIEEVVVIGSRSREGRTNLETAVPIDVFNAEQLTSTGRLELNQALAAAVPSFNFNQTSINDGTDIVRPATLRGLQPDQTLVLLNGKRRHSSSLVNINGSVGRGSAAVDMNAIPVSAIRAVEVLRDGASAQYGSDAIAGVINVRLKQDREGGGIDGFFGQYATEINAADRNASDGETLKVSGWKGLPLGEEGFLTLAAEYKDREPSNRAGLDPRNQYPETPLSSGIQDPRNNSFDRLNHRYGNGNAEDFSFFANAGLPISETAELYAFAGYQDREADSPGFYRRAGDATVDFRSSPRNLTEIYPNGFLPTIIGEVTDISMAGGVRGNFGEWDYDASVTFGNNELEYSVEDSINASLGPAVTQTKFDAGALEYQQIVVNADVTRDFDNLLPGLVTLSFGTEFREENFEISAGEPNSYIQGGYRGLLGVNFTAAQDPENDGVAFAGGSQVFAGFTPQSEVDEDRDSVSLYVDVEWTPNDQLLLGAAIRYEDYSDFGDETTGKIVARYDINESFAIRGGYSTGFRAPSLQQQFFTASSTNFIDGVPFEIGTFPAESAAAVALGGQSLDAETSESISAGFVWRTATNFYLTVDFYQIEIEDQIFLTENLGGTEVEDVLAAAGVTGVSRVRFFQNGIETKTTGIDIVARYDLDTNDMGSFEFSAGMNFSDVEVEKVPVNTVIPSLTLFSRDNRLTFEESAPQDKIILTMDWRYKAADVNVRATRYGEVVDPSNNPANDFTLDAEWIVDLSMNLEATDNINIGIGVDNVFDQYPTETPAGQSFNGIFPYSTRSPFGFAGRFAYLRAGFEW